MPEYVFSPVVWDQVWPLLGLAAVLALIAFLLALLFAPDVKGKLAGFVFTVSVTGGIVGQLTGQSREAAVDSVVPAVLSILGAMFAYLWTTNKLTDKAIPVAGASVALAVSLFVGVLWGSENRVGWEAYKESYDYLATNEKARLQLDFLKLEHERNMAKLRKTLAIMDAIDKAEKEKETPQPQPEE